MARGGVGPCRNDLCSARWENLLPNKGANKRFSYSTFSSVLVARAGSLIIAAVQNAQFNYMKSAARIVSRSGSARLPPEGM